MNGTSGDRDQSPRGVQAVVESVELAAPARYEGAAILRRRPHPISGASVPQLGVPDEALGFRPAPGTRFAVTVLDGGAATRYQSPGAWLERVGETWWFILEPE